ncbi:DUF2855 family protein [Pseudomonas turukhanskensis]|uniref:DUF2855 domain-containing protein n=1 Tax=Pseudomonas turukhanskensis TaxID=1806536 RepID=A0A9W6NEN1_9PSED|nr:DUF2855 family protein [Pseudomonas turukhanskensis]GLK88153.1 hypothetical protein GCM10017655_12150 [Pseudomonas turukhanskensis]
MSGRSNVTRLLTEKNALDQSHIEQHEEDLSAAPGEIVVKLERLSLTTNNITYAAFGDSMNYWDFFPTGDAGLGHVPVWGFADVVASNVEGVAVGERFYGYFPIASHLRMKPERVTDRGFYDGAEHRRNLTSAYNQYTRCSWDPYYSPATENLQILLKPLFLTSSMLADFLEDNAFFGATRLVFSSASSKTAFATAVCLDGAGVERVALTSRGNTAFVDGLGCYEQTLAYDDLSQLSTDQPTLYVDFSSDLALRDRVHQHFGSQLVYSCCAGSAQSTDPAQLTAITGPQPQLFFAPIQLRKRNADWGPVKVSEHIGEGLVRFYDQITPLLEVKVSQGFASAQELIGKLYHGQVPAKEGHVVEL